MKLARIALVIAVISGLLLILAGPGSRMGIWHFSSGFLMLRWALFLGVGSAVLALLFLLIPKTRQTNVGTLLTALIIGTVVAWVPWSGYQAARSVPAIHDISTDTENPPQFVDIAPLRADAPNPVEYMGEEIAVQQREAYPDIQALKLEQSTQMVFERALEIARNQNWEIVAAAPEDGRIEATATTLWFGFLDDVVIRISPSVSGSRLDIRSKSRVGRSDVGANAARIRKFVADFERGN